MKKRMRLFITLGVAVIIVVVIAVAIVMINRDRKDGDDSNNAEENVRVLEDGTRVNESERIRETRVVEGLEISEIEITERDNLTQLLAVVTNPTDETLGNFAISIRVLDREGNEIITIGGFIGEVEPGGTTQLNASATFDYVNAYNIEITRLVVETE